MASVISAGFWPALPSQFAASRTRASTSSLDTTAASLPRRIGFARRRQAIVLARGIGEALGRSGGSAAHAGFHALGHGGEICFAVERSKNGAAHQSRAA